MNKPKRQNTNKMIQRHNERLNKARKWLPTYDGQHIIKAYMKHFGVDFFCTLNDLQKLGVQFESGYIERATDTELLRREQNATRKAAQKELEPAELHMDQNDQFFYIAGYTPGVAPYGVTWDEMGLEPWDKIDDN